MILEKLKKRTAPLNLIISAAFLSFILAGHTPLHSQAGITLPQRGMCYVTWDRDRFASQYSDQSLEKLSNLGVEYLSIVATQYQDRYNSTDIKRTDQTPSDSSLKHAIKKAHKLGLKVMLKPHIDLIDKKDGTYWRADIGFATEEDWQRWFREYEKFILHYARMAKQLDVEIFCVGTELSFTTEKNSYWQDQIIPAVRKVFPGKLVYAANWDNFKNVGFWKDLDYIGIDAYFPLTYKPDPSVDDLKEGWEKWIQEIEIWQAAVNKPVIFTEIGYASTGHAPYMPWKGGTEGNADPEIQAKCYEAFFSTVWNREWLAGVYWWNWDTNVNAGGKYNRHFTPQNKPAQSVIEAHYKKYLKYSTYAMAD